MPCAHELLSRSEAACYALRAPPHPLNATFGCGTIDLPRPVRRVYDVVLFGFEADTLEIRLVESFGLVSETLLIESTFDHHGHPKECVWKTKLKYEERFARFENVKSKCVTTPPKGAVAGAQTVDWKYESYQQQMATRFVKKHVDPRSIVVFGHVDEIPSRAVYTTLATAPTLKPLPTNVAITNLHGHVGYVHKSTFAANGHPYTLGSPLVTHASAFQAIHPHGSFKNVWLIGGVHLTNYCYAGARVLKEWTATEARPDAMARARPTCRSQVLGCRRAATNGRRAPVALPLLLNCSPHRFPEWWHKDDSRLQSDCLIAPAPAPRPRARPQPNPRSLLH